MTAETRVTFNLWAVLAFLIIAGISSFSFLYAEGKETKVEQQKIIQRVTKLEAQYTFIIDRLERLTVSVEKASDKLEMHSKETKSREVVKKRNDIK